MSRMRDWTTMMGDMNWEDYGGSWGRQLRPGCWLVLRFENLEDCMGRDAPEEIYLCDVLQVDLNDMPEDTLRSALNSCGYALQFLIEEGELCIVQTYDGRIMASKSNSDFEIFLVECCVGYGAYAPLDSVDGKSYPSRVRAQARRLADEYFADQKALNRQLARPVNAIGSTAREFARGDFTSAVDRMRDPVTVKQVKQRSLTGECWLIQLQGTKACDTCEARDTFDCGGQEILKTGSNEKGIKVGKAGLEEDLLTPQG